MLNLASKLVSASLWGSAVVWAQAPATEAVPVQEFVKQLRSYCESPAYFRAAYALEGPAALKASMIWKCPYQVAFVVDGSTGLEFVFNGSEAWFFYPARSAGQGKLEKVEHYTSLENRVLGLWVDLWREPSRESRHLLRVEELYKLTMRVENRIQKFLFEPKKKGFPFLALGFSLEQSAKIPVHVQFEAGALGRQTAVLVPGSGQKLDTVDAKTFHPKLPDSKVLKEIPAAQR